MFPCMFATEGAKPTYVLHLVQAMMKWTVRGLGMMPVTEIDCTVHFFLAKQPVVCMDR